MAVPLLCIVQAPQWHRAFGVTGAIVATYTEVTATFYAEPNPNFFGFRFYFNYFCASADSSNGMTSLSVQQFLSHEY